MPKMPRQPADQPMMIERPLVIMFQDPDGRVITHIHPPAGYTHEHMVS